MCCCGARVALISGAHCCRKYEYIFYFEIIASAIFVFVIHSLVVHFPFTICFCTSERTEARWRERDSRIAGNRRWDRTTIIILAVVAVIVLYSFLLILLLFYMDLLSVCVCMRERERVGEIRVYTLAAPASHLICVCLFKLSLACITQRCNLVLYWSLLLFVFIDLQTATTREKEKKMTTTMTATEMKSEGFFFFVQYKWFVTKRKEGESRSWALCSR